MTLPLKNWSAGQRRLAARMPTSRQRAPPPFEADIEWRAFSSSQCLRRTIERPVAANCSAVHAANIRQAVASAGLMIEAAIIPDNQIPILPLMPVVESLVRHDGEKLVEQRLRFGIRHVCNADGEARRDVKRLTTRLRMGAHDRVEHLFRRLLVPLVVILSI